MVAVVSKTQKKRSQLILLLCLMSLLYGTIFNIGANAKEQKQLNFSSFAYSPWHDLPHSQGRFIKFNHRYQGEEATTWLALEIRLEPEWHTYWLNPGDSGAPPEIYATTANTEEKQVIAYPPPERITVGPLTTYGYSNFAYYFIATPSDAESYVADVLVCKEECIPGSINVLATSISAANAVGDNSELQDLQRAFNQIPTESEQILGFYSDTRTEKKRFEIPLPAEAKIQDIFWFPNASDSLSRPNTFQNNEGQQQFYASSDASHPRALISYKINNTSQANFIQFEKIKPNIFIYLSMAFLGGIILNLMPCVFPIISLKAFSIANASGKTQRLIRQENFIYSAGVLASFVMLGIGLAIIRQSGQAIGWGFQLQNPAFVIFLALVFAMLSLIFFGFWQINLLPSKAQNLSSSAKPGYGYNFMTGVLAVLVASPCTAPFMGASIGFALTQSISSIFLIFTALGLGMASPFILFAIFPAFAKCLPAPGNWMNWFKYAMGMLLLASAVWLAWLAVQLLTSANSSTNADASDWTPLTPSNWHELEHKEAAFVNFTADWCVTCKVNEKLVFDNHKVQQFFKQEDIRLYKVDWTKRDADIGEKLAEYGRIGIPLYLYFPPESKNPQILPEVLTPEILMNRLKQP